MFDLWKKIAAETELDAGPQDLFIVAAGAARERLPVSRKLMVASDEVERTPAGIGDREATCAFTNLARKARRWLVAESVESE